MAGAARSGARDLSRINEQIEKRRKEHRRENHAEANAHHCGARYWADSPDGGPPGWGLRFAVTFLFPK
jgi:hypothetical protein